MSKPLPENCDHRFMHYAICLAQLGEGKTRPNPLVGAVVVKENTIIGKGWHRAYGLLHAEREALQDCERRNADPAGATLYVTLEPCCHFGKQPPCTHAIVQARITRVVVGSRDPNPLVAGKGVAFLRAHGVEVVEDCMRGQCDALNAIFFHHITQKVPYIALKYAMTADGKIATRTGKSQWITGTAARRHVHQLRNKYAALCAGIGTVLADDPLLTCRIAGKRNPLRIICDSALRLPLDSKIAATAHTVPTIAAACSDCVTGQFLEKKQLLEQKGIEVVLLPKEAQSTKPCVDLTALVSVLSSKGIDSMLIEGGGKIHAAALQARIVQKLYCYIAPKIFGGTTAASPVGGIGAGTPDEALHMQLRTVRPIEEDLLLEYEVKHVYRNN